MHQHLFGKSAQPRELMHFSALIGNARTVICSALESLPVAEIWTPGNAILACTTERGQTGDHMVARRDIAHIAADRGYDAGCFVSQDAGQIGVVFAFQKMQV